MGSPKRTFKAEGDTWSVRLARRPPSDATQAVLFFCVTTDQRPYRVVEVPRERLPDSETLARLSETELEQLFSASCSLDFPHSFHTDSALP